MPKRSPLRRSLATLAIGLLTCVLIPTQAVGRALVRFIHAVPGVGRAMVQVGTGSGTADFGSIGFGQVSSWRSLRSGSFAWGLLAGGKTLVHGTATVGNGAYDIVVLDKPGGVTLGVYRAQAGRPGSSLVRVIHAAPELGSPELTVDGKRAVRSLRFTAATPYLPLAPGVHSLAAMRPGTRTALVAVAGIRYVPGAAYSAIVVGSRGQRVRVVTVIDRGAPLTRTAAATSRAGAAPGASSVVVRAGDSLWNIARRLLPAGASDAEIQRKLTAIWDRNALRIGTGDPNLIFSGQRLLV